MHRTFYSIVAVAALVAAADVASAQGRYKQIEFQEFLVNDVKFHNKLISMHAEFFSDEAVYSDATFNEEYMKSMGVTEKKYFRFSVRWRAQTKEWLYPVIEKKGNAPAIWAALKDLKKGQKLTLYGKVKRLGDTGGMGAASDPTRGRTVGGGYAEVPSILKIDKMKLGWVKTLPEYIQDLGGNEKLVAETIVMLKREGPGVLPALAKVAGASSLSETQRINACRAIAEFGVGSYARKLELVIKKTDSEKLRSAAVRAMGQLRGEEAVKTLKRMMTAREPDEWAPYGAAELLAEKLVAVEAFEKAFGKDWEKQREPITAACLEMAGDAFDRKKFERTDRFCTFAIAMNDKNGEAFHLRGKARQALSKKQPQMAKLASADFSKAVELGEESPDLFLHHAEALLAAGDKKGAARYAGLVLEDQPKNVAARKIKAQAEGKSVAMIDSRTCRMWGCSVRVPAQWQDLKDYVKLKNKEVLRVRGFPKGKTGKNPPQASLLVVAYDEQINDLMGAPDWERHLKDTAKRINVEPVETGKVDIGGFKGAWMVSKRQVQGETLMTYWGIVNQKGKTLVARYFIGEALFKEYRPTFAESLKTLKWDAAFKKK